MFSERCLKRRKLSRLSQSLYRNDGAAFGLNGEHETRANGQAVDNDRACAADTVLTANVGACQSCAITQRVR